MQNFCPRHYDGNIFTATFCSRHFQLEPSRPNTISSFALSSIRLSDFRDLLVELLKAFSLKSSTRRCVESVSSMELTANEEIVLDLEQMMEEKRVVFANFEDVRESGWDPK